MSWAKLNRFELQAARLQLGLSTKEAGECAGKSQNSWLSYENGQRNIPADIDLALYAWIQQRNDVMNELSAGYDEAIIGQDGAELTLKVYPEFGDFLLKNPKADFIDWKIYQSAVGALFSEGGNVELIE